MPTIGRSRVIVGVVDSLAGLRAIREAEWSGDHVRVKESPHNTYGRAL